MSCVVVECANDHTACPRSDPSERSPLQLAGIVACFHIAHFAVMLGRNPRGKRFDLAGLPAGSDPAQVDPSLAGELFDAGWKVRLHVDGVQASFRSNRMFGSKAAEP